MAKHVFLTEEWSERTARRKMLSHKPGVHRFSDKIADQLIAENKAREATDDELAAAGVTPAAQAPAAEAPKASGKTSAHTNVKG